MSVFGILYVFGSLMSEPGGIGKRLGVSELAVVNFNGANCRMASSYPSRQI